GAVAITIAKSFTSASTSFLENNLNMGPNMLRANASLFARLVLAVTLSMLFAVAAQAQAKPERQSKAAKAAKAEPSTQTAQPAAAGESGAAPAEPSKPEEKVFKGMKYRL